MVQYDKLHEELMEQLEGKGELTDQQIHEIIDELLLGSREARTFALDQKADFHRKLFDSVRGLDILQELVDNSAITEIMVNQYDQIFIERDGRVAPYPKSFSSREKLEDVIHQIVGKCNRVVNESSPIVDARLDNGSRVNVVTEPACIGGPVLTIRRFPDTPITMERLIHMNSITEEAAAFLEQLVKSKYSILIGGGTSAGKTTFLNALSNYIPSDERIITIEDTAELQIQGIDNLVRLEAKSATMEGGRDITIRDLIKTALRMRPDRIVVGEVRKEEAIDLLQALNTGHDGSLGTAHANSTYDMVSRLETMVLMGMQQMPLEAVRRQIASGIDIMIHLGRLRDHSRRVLEICEVIGFKDGNVNMVPLFQFNHRIGLLERTNALYHTEKLERM